MQATADSSTVKIKGAIKANEAIVELINMRDPPNRDINKCPAIKLAVNRTQSVIGRIRFLVISIATIKDISALGVPWGTRWMSMWFVLFTQPHIMMAVQEIKDSGRVMVRCEVTENTCGYKATKFITKIEINKVIKTFSVLPPLPPRVKFTSL